MSLNNIGLGMVLTASDMASGVLRRVGAEFSGLQQTVGRGSLAMRVSMGAATVGAAALAAGVGGLAGAYMATGEAGRFGNEIARVGALSGATTEELRQFHDAAIQAGIATQFSPTQAAEGLSELAALGYTAQEAITGMSGALNLAAGGQIPVAQASATLGAALRAFSRDASQAELTTDQLMMTANLTALQANELQTAIGTVARGAGAAKQGLDEMLISMGLVRNTGVSAEVAASSVSSALLEMSQRQADFRRLGVEVDDGAGNFRNFIDVVADTSVALEEQYTSSVDRAAAANRLFGAFGQTAFEAISAQIAQGVRTSTGEILRGAEAVEYLRTKMGNAAGTAQEFADRMLGTFEGQKTLLQGTIQTLLVVVGEPLARVFRPIVTTINAALVRVLEFFRALPERAQTVIAAVTVAASALSTLFGAFSLFVAGIAAAWPVIVAIAPVFAKLALVAVPLGIAFVALGGAAALFALAVRRNIGGLGDTFNRIKAQFSLAWRAIVEIVSGRSLSTALLEELRSAENAGVRRFVERIQGYVNNARAFFVSAWATIQARLRAMAPTFQALTAAFSDLFDAFSSLGGRSGAASGRMGSSMRSAADAGRTFGRIITDVLRLVVVGMTNAARFVEGFVSGIRKIREWVQPVVRPLADAFRNLGQQFVAVWRQIAEALGLTTNSEEDFRSFGQTVASVAGFIGRVLGNALMFVVDVLTVVIGVVRLAIEAFGMFFRFLRHVGVVAISEILGAIDSMANAFDRVLQYMGRIAAAMPESMRPGFMSGLIDVGERAEGRIRGREQNVVERRRALEMSRSEIVNTTQMEEGGARDRANTAMLESMGRLLGPLAGMGAGGNQRIEVAVNIDGETAGRAVANANRSRAEREGRPVPVGVNP